MASCTFPDIEAWITALPPITQWRNTNSISICCISSQASINVSIAKNLQSHSLYLSILANFNNNPISLWTSKPIKFNSNSKSQENRNDNNIIIATLLPNLIEDVLKYGSNNNKFSPKLPLPLLPSTVANFKAIFNVSFLTLSFLVCFYEAPSDLRSQCLTTLKNHLVSSQSRQASKMLVRFLGSNMEEQWMRSINLAITNWTVELQAATNHTLKTPSPLFSHALSTLGLWKVQLYCPVIAMDIVNSNSSPDPRLLFSLNYHQLEGVIQFNHKVMIREKWIDVMVNTDNIRFDVIRLVNETLMNERGVGAAEKHFPSRISLQLTPITLQTNVFSVSVSKSSENPTREIGVEKSLEASLDPQSLLMMGLNVSAGESATMSLKPWKFEESVYGNSANLNWYLHDSGDGREVFSSKPSKFGGLIHPKSSWLKDRYSSAYRPFTRQGGVIFAGDEYGESVCWKVDKGAIGKTMEWEIKGWIWLTYWPNKYRTFYNDNRRLEFREILQFTLA